MFLGFFGLRVLALEVGERYVQRLVPEPIWWTLILKKPSGWRRIGKYPS
jgi:hypothetical protein